MFAHCGGDFTISKKSINVSAYITLEATFIMPLTIMILISIIYMTFYLYNQCIMFQTSYLSALRGSQEIDKEDKEVSEYVYDSIRELSFVQIMTSHDKSEVMISSENIKVSLQTKIELINYIRDVFLQDTLDMEVIAEAKRIYPAKLLRSKYR